MAVRIVIELPSGERTFDVPDPMTYRELGNIKRMTGYRAGEIGEALIAGDTDAVLALAVVASARAGDPVTLEQLENLEVGALRVVADEEEDPTEAAAPVEDAGGESAEMTPADGGTPA